MTDGVEIRRADWTHDKAALRAVRETVFIEEQQVPRELEWDDADETAIHFIAEDRDGRPVGTARLLPDGQIGRMAVLKELRALGVGRRLLDAAVASAADQGLFGVFLHAQLTARDFYARAGFHSVGDEFMEAGIRHIQMERDLGVPFEPQPDVPRQVIKADERPVPHDHPELGTLHDELRMLAGTTALAAAILDLARHARRELLIFHHDLHPALFDGPEFADALSVFARRSPRARVRILIHDVARLVGDSHRLVQLARRLPSAVTIRVVDPERRIREDAFVVADRTGLVVQPRAGDEHGFANHNDAPLARQYCNAFDRLHDHAASDPELRRLTL